MSGMTQETREELVLQAVRFSQNALAETLGNHGAFIPEEVRTKLRAALLALCDLPREFYR
jgi:hypothetical protein